MPATLSYPHIEKLNGEPARLERMPRVRVAQIVMNHFAHGWSAEEICRQHQRLTPAEVHAALAYYFDHRDEIDREIERELAEANHAAAHAARPSFLFRVIAARRS